MSKCKVCGGDSHGVIVNILGEGMPICDWCCLTITKQVVATLQVEKWECKETGEVTTLISSGEQQ